VEIWGMKMNLKMTDDAKLSGVNLLGVDWLRKARVDLGVTYDSINPDTESITLRKRE
jgi:hypothetical protein